MTDKKDLQKSIKRAILKLKNGSASSEEISSEFASAIESYLMAQLETKKRAS